MPISRGEFEQGRTEPAAVVLELFRSNPDTAYTEEELFAALAGSTTPQPRNVLQEILKALEAKEFIQSKQIGDAVYYIYRKETLGYRLPRR